ncbi:hypothetical protein BP00DRAFT_152563 [Aspergillus indologenus CBS 114.80]|uniref:Subtelomeric hrmA-associated cluster protein AFUB-079030/YDR124W-like helical bundle domain-containing protein n=1 Tax=Aspergillus indologenus CBS 114.80 TaxID=1450541 RepID=A0A2V5II76_9EURO|nr:hypothetical protein BP00DRAFT_152563 [Aspergillus indologenus CBS 114.80]
MASKKAACRWKHIFTNLSTASLSRILLVIAETLHPNARPIFSNGGQQPSWWPPEITYTHPRNLKREHRLKVIVHMLEAYSLVDTRLTGAFQQRTRVQLEDISLFL